MMIANCQNVKVGRAIYEIAPLERGTNTESDGFRPEIPGPPKSRDRLTISQGSSTFVERAS